MSVLDGFFHPVTTSLLYLFVFLSLVAAKGAWWLGQDMVYDVVIGTSMKYHAADDFK